MKTLLTVVLMITSTLSYGQCHKCGMFGMLSDNYEDLWVARFTHELDSIRLESAQTCQVLVVPCEVYEVRNGKRKTILSLRIKHRKFDGAPYRIRYPTGAWGIVKGQPGYW